MEEDATGDKQNHQLQFFINNRTYIAYLESILDFRHAFLRLRRLLR